MGLVFNMANSCSRRALTVTAALPPRPTTGTLRVKANGRRSATPNGGRKAMLSAPQTSTGGGGGGSRIGSGKGLGGSGGGGSGDKRQPIVVLTLAYAAYTVVGGVMGYRKAGSKNSLITSLAVAAGMAASAYQISSNADSYLGIFTALFIVVALGGYMAYGCFKKRGKFFPQGATAGLSLVLAAYYGIMLNGNVI